MDRARNDPGIKKAILDIDSPGGEIAGVDTVWSAHTALAKEKTTEVHAGNMLASAAYWIASPATKILAESPLSRIGSIGVIIAGYDMTGALDQMGIKKITIVSKNAPDKGPDPAQKSGREVYQKQLDAIERVFYDRIIQGRHVTYEHIQEHFGQGGILLAHDPSAEHEDAIRAGMIDGLVSSDRHSHPSNTDTFAQSGQSIIIQEGQTMSSLTELLQANPAAAAELDRIKAEAQAAGRKEAQAEYKATVAKCMIVLGGTAYPQQIREIAGKVLTGDSHVAAIESAVAIYDAEQERKKSETAQAETAAQGAVSAQAPDGKSGDEKAMDEAGAKVIADAKARREGVKTWA
jgi:ClpP class serine protease